MKKILLTLILLSTSLNFYSQSAKDELLKQNIEQIVEELKFMYHYDQATREYLYFQTFDKSITDSIENLSDDLKKNRLEFTPIKSDSLKNQIWQNYITPMDKNHTKRMIEITKKYGFPSTERLKKYSEESIDFSPLILLIHSPFSYSEDLKKIAKKEKEQGRMKKCDYGYLLWHLNGRSDFQPMLDNGYVMTKKENGTFDLKPVDCD
ncbi:hypothetical protein [Christiangramia echinicola]|uniref:Uncharacterized protein n=1 Tax=Christiangramia echinicola TaxID=279359 RepID=A0A1H1LBS3_9FLAO|nr:hypothetical protein [Christiangramia echinicola]SDR71877.1 hypothetical protein SAMN04488552_0687 [Christiangramia echinicola]